MTAGLPEMNMNACLHVVQRVLLTVLLFAPTMAAADSGIAGIRWACWYEADNLVLRCLLDRAPATDRRAESGIAVDPALPQLVRTIRRSPDQLTDRQISIPLWNVPYEMSFVAELADSVMCGTRPDCAVVFDANADGRAPVRVAALRAGASEEEVAEMNRQEIALLASDENEPVAERKTRRRARLNG